MARESNTHGNRDGRGRSVQPLRRLRIERREAVARANGWVGAWPPEKPSIESAADCEHYLHRLEGGEERAGFLSVLGLNLAAFFEHLKAEHFRRFAAVLLDVAENPGASHRSRLRAVQAAIRPLRRAWAILAKLQKTGGDPRQAHLESLLLAFCEELSTDSFGRLASVLVSLTGPSARTTSDRVRACDAALMTVTEAMELMTQVRTMQQRCSGVDYAEDSPEARRAEEQAEADLAEMRAQTGTDLENGRFGTRQVQSGPRDTRTIAGQGIPA